MIDINNGGLKLNIDSKTIRKGLTKNEFKESVIFDEVLTIDEYGYTRYYLKLQKIGTVAFTVVIYFDKNDIIDSVSFSMQETIPLWENWSKDEEQKLKIKHDEWLANCLGLPPYKYSWGTIESVIDIHDNTSSIVIRYFNN
ncbi:MAG: hypothetical protein PHN21_06870 [Erysipelotrichaceae bacterium]|nr:hypothetical protein [Erysipelotrichaceae bacterium]